MVSMGDPFADLDPKTVAEVLAQKGWSGLVHSADEVAVNLGNLVAVATAGKVGDDMLEKLLGAHGDLPRAPTHTHYAGGEQRTVRFFRRPDGRSFANAPNMHGACPGVTVLTSGRELLPPTLERGIVLRWHKSSHAATTAIPELPEWFVEMARDPAAAQRAWGTARPTKDQVRQLADWESTLVRARGKPVATFGNVMKIMRSAPCYSGRFRLNEMSQDVEFERRPLIEAYVADFREQIEDAPWGGFSPSRESISDAIRAMAERQRYHPVQDYLRGLPPWDGTVRLNDFASRALNAAPDPLSEVMLRRWFISAVARAMDPGCQVDTSLVLVGDQGFKKSSFFRALAPEWFGNTEIRIGDKDGLQQIHANWITEWAEIDGITSRRHASEVKAFIARRVDDFRPPYGRKTQKFKRSCVIVGSTNETEFLTDPTGSRRFWVVRVCSVIDALIIERVRDQLWAEALVAFRAGEQFWLDRDQDIARERAAEEFRVRDAWEGVIARWLAETWPGVKTEKGYPYLTTDIVLRSALRLEAKDMNHQVTCRVARAMAALGYVAGKRTRLTKAELAKCPGPALVYPWFPPDPEPEAEGQTEDQTGDDGGPPD